MLATSLSVNGIRICTTHKQSSIPICDSVDALETDINPLDSLYWVTMKCPRRRSEEKHRRVKLR